MKIHLSHYFAFGFPALSHYQTVFPAASLLWDYLCADYCTRCNYIHLGLCDLSISVSSMQDTVSLDADFEARKDTLERKVRNRAWVPVVESQYVCPACRSLDLSLTAYFHVVDWEPILLS